MTVKLKRLTNWPALLDIYLTTNMPIPFEWGTHDCCLFAAGAVEAITGTQLASKWKAAYTSKDTALHLVNIASRGGIKGLIEELARNANIPLIRPKMAQRGDIMMVTTDSEDGVGISLGVVIGHQIAFPGLQGLTFIDYNKFWDKPTTKAWKIG